MGKVRFIMLAMFVALAGCSKDSEQEATNSFTFDKILGQWVVKSYYTSGGYYVPSSDGEYYEFTDKKEYIHYLGEVLEETERGTFEFDPKSSTIACKAPKGWDFTIFVSFTEDNKATFDIKGKTQNQSKNVKVERN